MYYLSCPENKCDESVKLCQGDVMLCPDSESERVKGEGAAAALTKSTTGGTISAPTDHEKADLHPTQVAADPLMVVNEVLCFISNNIYLMPKHNIIKLCSDFYSDMEVESVKKTLFQLKAVCDINTIGDILKGRGMLMFYWLLIFLSILLLWRRILPIYHLCHVNILTSQV